MSRGVVDDKYQYEEGIRQERDSSGLGRIENKGMMSKGAGVMARKL